MLRVRGSEVNDIYQTLQAATALLKQVGASFALIGGLAVSVRSEPRFTRDVDLAVSVSDDSMAEALLGTFGANRYQVLAVVEQEAAGRLASARLVPPEASGAGVVVDLLFASSGIEPEIVRQAQSIELMTGLTVPVARRGHLVALKILARDDNDRPQDWADLQALIKYASPEDLQLARDGLELITSRGFHRGRHLIEDFEALIA